MDIRELAAGLNKTDIQLINDPQPVGVLGNTLYIPLPGTGCRIRVTVTQFIDDEYWVQFAFINPASGVIDSVTRELGVIDNVTLLITRPKVSDIVADLLEYAAVWRI
ncbi:hypothetical protein ACIQXD_29460 [Streptomyces uncialis]|uniref:hypothetical protein n=1 Tax=Streptomyces uncialis TaxID=1048205 RepID=UPI0037F9DE4E